MTKIIAFSMAFLIHLSFSQSSSQNRPVYLIVESKWYKGPTKNIQRVFVVPLGQKNPVIYLPALQKHGRGGLVKWRLSAENERSILKLVKAGKTLRVIEATNQAVGSIKKSSPKGFAIFNQKDISGGLIRAREAQ